MLWSSIILIGASVGGLLRFSLGDVLNSTIGRLIFNPVDIGDGAAKGVCAIEDWLGPDGGGDENIGAGAVDSSLFLLLRIVNKAVKPPINGINIMQRRPRNKIDLFTFLRRIESSVEESKDGFFVDKLL